MCIKKLINKNTMGRPKKKKEDKQLVEPVLEEPKIAQPQKNTTDIQKALLLNYSKITLKRRGLI
jgi:hypothetical protein